MRYGVALYSNEKWCFKIVGETENEFLCEHFAEDFKHFQNGDQPFTLRKIMFGNKCYKEVDEYNKYLQRYINKQLDLFGTIGETK